MTAYSPGASMRTSNIQRGAPRLATVLSALAPLLAPLTTPSRAAAQSTAADADEVLAQVQDLQKEFERYRTSRIPVTVARPNGVCDEQIGSICIWFGGEDEESFPAEFREVQQARIELIRQLDDAFEQVPDKWILGQLVHYLVESRNVDEAERVASECGIAETWWCSALLGYVLHVRGEYVDAEQTFRAAIADMPVDVRELFTTPRYIFTDSALEAFEAQSPEEQTRQWELLWRLSDPLFLFEGNDRLTDHYARWVVAMNRRVAADPIDGQFAEAPDPEDAARGTDKEEALIRYGRNTGYSRTHDPARAGVGSLVDTRRVVGHHHPKSRGYLFPEQFLASPSDIPPESWITAPREARTWYAPLYTPDIMELETQVGRFRRGDEMLVVGAYRPTLPDAEGRRMVSAWDATTEIEGEPHATLFLVPENGERPFNVRSRDPEGVLVIQGPPGRYVSSLEVVDLEERRAWRARQGVVQLPLTPGLVDVSDLMILKEGAPIPASLEEAYPYLRPGVRLRPGERFPVLWEVYGLRVQEPVRVTLGFSRGRPGFLSRVGQFLGILEPDQPVDVTFDDAGPDTVQSVFRAVELELPNLEPGEYTLHLRLDLAGRTPLVTSRPITVEAPGGPGR